MKKQNCFKFQPPHDKYIRKCFTYIAKDDNGDERLWLDIATHSNSCVKSLIANIKKRPELNMVKKGHRFTHGNSNDITNLFKEAGILTPRSRKQ